MFTIKRSFDGKAQFLVSFGAFLVFACYVCGLWFGVGITVLILAHEAGHFFEIRRRGLTLDLPVFLPGVGAYVRYQASSIPDSGRSAISLAGPLIGSIATLFFVFFWTVTANSICGQLVREGIRLNALNLVPIWILDGRQAMIPLSTTQRILLLLIVLSLWYFLHESMFLYVAIGTGWRAAADRTTKSNSRLTAYFAGVIAFLGLMAWLVPDHVYYEPRVPLRNLWLLCLGITWLLILFSTLAIQHFSKANRST